MIHNNNPELMKHHLVSAINKENNEVLEYFFTVSYQASLETIRSVPEFAEFLTKLESFDTFGRQKKVFERAATDKFRVLNHG